MQDTPAGGLCLEWRNLNYYVPAAEQSNYSFWKECRKQKEIQILKDVNGHLKAGDLIAILGCSGAGKTTLLAAISQRLRGNLTGDVVLNGMAMERKQMIRISGFLPQFEINVKTFTAFEHLYFMSHFKMHRNTTKAQKRERVNDLLLVVGLRDAAHTRIQQLSGGERKRLSLAEELITDPLFLFCDEPTTGLDSYNAYTMIKTLRHLCTRKRVTKYSLSSLYGEDSFSTPSDESSRSSIEMEIENSREQLMESINDLPALNVLNRSSNAHRRKAAICSIHQPTSDIFELFTHIIIMDGGRIVYQGLTENAMSFFTDLGYTIPQNCNPADFYLKTVNDSHKTNKETEKIIQKYKLETSGLYAGSWLLQRSSSGDCLQNIINFKKIRWTYQVYLLVIRFMTENIRNIRDGIISMLFFMITSITLAIMYSGTNLLLQTSVQDIGGALYTLSSEIIFTFSYGVTFVFPSCLPIMRREVGEGTYSMSAYYIATMLSSIPTAFVRSYLYFTVVYTFLYYSRGFLLYLSMGFVLSLASVSATAYGLFLSSLFESDKMACECAAPFDLVFLIFGGAYMNVDSIPLFKYISLFFYTNEALMYDFWIGVDEIACPENDEHPCVRNGKEVLEKSSYRTSEYTFWLDCIGLLGIAVIFHLITFFLIRKYVHRSGYY